MNNLPLTKGSCLPAGREPEGVLDETKKVEVVKVFKVIEVTKDVGEVKVIEVAKETKVFEGKES